MELKISGHTKYVIVNTESRFLQFFISDNIKITIDGKEVTDGYDVKYGPCIEDICDEYDLCGWKNPIYSEDVDLEATYEIDDFDPSKLTIYYSHAYENKNTGELWLFKLDNVIGYLINHIIYDGESMYYQDDEY